MPRLIIHAGFPKCGSTTIFSTLKANLDLLVEKKIFVFNRFFELPRRSGRLQPPLWELQAALGEASETQAIREAMSAAIARVPEDATVILSSENLSAPAMAGMFVDFDSRYETSLVFYFRPQVDWIPSGWKQWEIKDGTDLGTSIDRYLGRHQPDYLGTIRQWQRMLPRLSVSPRPFVSAMMAGGQPDIDFISRLGVDTATLQRPTEKSNPSIDYALLHLMMRNSAALFENRHDNRILRILLERLPQQYHRTNAPMLSQAQADRIADHFEADNRVLLTEFMGLAEDEAEALLAGSFRKVVSKPAYTELTEVQIRNRARRILREIADFPEDFNEDAALVEMLNSAPSPAP